MKLREQLERQYGLVPGVPPMDPDSIFPEVQSCDLEEIFGCRQGVNRRYVRTQCCCCCCYSPQSDAQSIKMLDAAAGMRTARVQRTGTQTSSRWWRSARIASIWVTSGSSRSPPQQRSDSNSSLHLTSIIAAQSPRSSRCTSQVSNQLQQHIPPHSLSFSSTAAAQCTATSAPLPEVGVDTTSLARENAETLAAL